MHAHYFFVDQCNEWHMIETVVERLPQGNLIPSLDLIKEPIHSCDGLTLVVSSKNNYLIGVPDFERKQQANDLARLLSSIYIVAHEQILCRLVHRYNSVLLVLLVLIAHLFEHVQQISVLSVDVSKYLDRCFKLDK